MRTKLIRGIPESAIEAARELRRRETPAEAILWEHLRAKRLNGLRFRRQHPIGPFIVDFCCPSHKLVVEIDGDVHNNQREQDAARTAQLESYGYRVLRFSNLEVVDYIHHVLESISNAIYLPPFNTE